MVIGVHLLTPKLDDILYHLSLPCLLRIQDKLLGEALKENVLSFYGVK